MRPNWDIYFMIIADAVSLRMSCDRARIGAVITSQDHHILTTGYGGAPSGWLSCDEAGHELVEINGRQSCVRTVHAEENAIATAARHGIGLAGGTLYTTASPCYDCIKLIAQVGIRTVGYGATYVGGRQAARVFELAEQNQITMLSIPLTDALTHWTPPPSAVSVKP